MKFTKIKSEPQNRRISNIEFRRVVALRAIVFLRIDKIHSFDIHYSIFAFSKFLLRSSWPLFRPEAALKPDT